MNITDIIIGVIGLMVAIAACVLIPWLKTKLNAEQLSYYESLIDVAVEAAEQLYTSKEGKAKKEYVLAYLEQKGISLDIETLENVVESSVLRLHNELYGTSKSKKKLNE